jgi:RNA polymerase subunit RPABC4/transcription elongation factor Spt4
MNTVGHSESTITITDYSRAPNNENGRRPAASRYDENAKSIKFLSSIVYPESLAKDAAKELRAVGVRREFRRGANNDRNYSAIVANFDNLWRALYQVGSISLKAATTGQTHDTALLHDDKYCKPCDDSALIIRDSVRGQHACRNCWGMNHDEANCPSPKQTRRIEDVMEVLIRILRARGNPESSSTATQLPAKPKSDRTTTRNR